MKIDKNNLDDHIIIKHILNGDESMYRILIDRYKNQSLSMAMAMVKNIDLAEEIIQHVFVNVFLKLSSFKNESSFSTWLYRIVVNACYKELKKQGRNIKSEFLNHQDTTKTDHQLLQNEQSEIIHIILAQMNALEATVLQLFYIGEQTISEISIITGKSKNNVKVILHRARKHFKDQIKRQYGSESGDIL